jgi:hypothetical protein
MENKETSRDKAAAKGESSAMGGNYAVIHATTATTPDRIVF